MFWPLLKPENHLLHLTVCSLAHAWSAWRPTLVISTTLNFTLEQQRHKTEYLEGALSCLLLLLPCHLAHRWPSAGLHCHCPLPQWGKLIISQLASALTLEETGPTGNHSVHRESGCSSERRFYSNRDITEDLSLGRESLAHPLGFGTRTGNSGLQVYSTGK